MRLRRSACSSMPHRTVAIAGALAALCVLLSGLAFGQAHHHRHHDHYSGWVNQDGKGARPKNFTQRHAIGGYCAPALAW